MIDLILIIVIVGVASVLAHTAQRDPRYAVPALLVIMVLVVAIPMAGLSVMGMAIIPDEVRETMRLEGTEMPHVELLPALVLFVLSAMAGLVAFTLVLLRDARALLKRLLGDGVSYNPDSMTHTLGLVLGIGLVIYTGATYVQVGGLEGLAVILEEAPLSIPIVVLTGLAYTCIGLLGAGLFVRRSPREVAQRLGLRRPHWQDLVLGGLVGAALFAFFTSLAVLWVLLADPDILRQQTSAMEQITLAFSGSLLAGFLLALSAGISEEILYRGLLQPVYGVFLTSALFALSHVQYTLTPAWLVIFGVGVGFALLRKYLSTTAAIVAHFVYNFLPFVLLFFLSLLQPLLQDMM